MNKKFKKGAAKSAMILILSTLLMAMFFIWSERATNYAENTIKLNLESFEILKLKSTFGLFNTSLGTTWFISTVQAVFQTSDEGIGCGYAEAGETITTTEGYWMQTKITDGRDTDETRENGQLVERLPTAKKYNSVGRNPQICYPQERHITAWLNKKIAEGDYLNLKSNPIDAGGVAITLPRKGDGTVDSNIELKIEDNLVEARFAQDITATFLRGSISKQMENQNIVFTSLKQMVAAGRGVVEAMLLFGDGFYKAFNPNLHYTPTTSSKDAYLTQLSNIIENKIKQESRLPAGVFSGAHVETSLLAPTGANLIMQKYSGLMLYYKATVSYADGTREVVSTSVPTFNWPTDSRDMNSCFGFRRLPGDDPGTFHYGIDIRPLDPAIDEPIRAATDGTVVDVHNGCPNTGSLGSQCRNFGNNKRYGNFVMIKHNDNLYTFYAHLKLDSIAVTVGQQVAAGQQIAVMGSSGRSTGVHVHFEVRTGSGKLDPCNYIDCSQSTGRPCKASGTPTETVSGNYYYHDEETNTFEKRPITLEYTLEDYVEALRCGDWNPPSPVMFTWKTGSDLACCAGQLFYCKTTDETIPGIAGEQVIQLNSQTSSDRSPQSACNSVLGGALECTPNGFRTT